MRVVSPIAFLVVAMRLCRAFVLCGLVLLVGCASLGSLEHGEAKYRLNKFSVAREDDGQYRLWVWRLAREGPFDLFGYSPAGVQILIPADFDGGDPCKLGGPCQLWVRGFWSVAGDLRGDLWTEVEQGTIHFREWNPQLGRFVGKFEGSSDGGRVSGRFKLHEPEFAEAPNLDAPRSD